MNLLRFDSKNELEIYILKNLTQLYAKEIESHLNSIDACSSRRKRKKIKVKIGKNKFDVTISIEISELHIKSLDREYVFVGFLKGSRCGSNHLMKINTSSCSTRGMRLVFTNISSHKDCFGLELSKGDNVFYIAGGELCKGVVCGFNSKKVVLNGNFEIFKDKVGKA